MRTKITIEMEDGETTVIEAEGLSYVAERGYEVRYDLNGEPAYRLNGHRRFLLKAWSGCQTFDSFKARTGDGIHDDD